MSDDFKNKPVNFWDRSHPSQQSVEYDSIEERCKYDAKINAMSPEELKLFIQRQNEIVNRIIGGKK